jgi:hypothetical protein
MLLGFIFAIGCAAFTGYQAVKAKDKKARLNAIIRVVIFLLGSVIFLGQFLAN